MKRRFFFLFFFWIITVSNVFAQKQADVIAYILTYKDIAMAEMKRTGVPASIKLAQGIHETEAGKSALVLKSNNHFGIKCKSTWMGDKVYHDDDARGECFRSYDEPEQSYMDHSDFLRGSQRYSFLFELDPTDYEGWAYGLKKAGYATNIRYSQVLINLIRTYNLQDYSLIALGKLKESDHFMAANSAKIIVPIIKPSEELEATDTGPDLLPPPSYPAGQFNINNTKVIYAAANTAWLSLAEQYNIPLSRLLDFNDLESDEDILQKPQLIYLQRKRKLGSNEFHIIKNGEDLYDICQAEGIRYESLLELNHLNGSKQPAVNEKLNLQYSAAAAPLLVTAWQKNKLDPSFEKPDIQESRLPVKSTAANNTDAGRTAEYTTHLVSTKETLYSISKKYGVDLEKVMKWNGLDSMNVKIGQSLIIYKSN